jgi:hypothetical protein
MILYDGVAARRDAPFHVQVKLTDLPAVTPNDYVRIGGAVIRVFRGETTLKFGDSVSFTLWVCDRGKEPTGPPYVYFEDLIGMGNVEAYLDGKPPDCDVVGYEFTVLREPSEKPTLTVGDLHDVPARFGHSARASNCRAARKWWQFWKS